MKGAYRVPGAGSPRPSQDCLDGDGRGVSGADGRLVVDEDTRSELSTRGFLLLEGCGPRLTLPVTDVVVGGVPRS